MSPSRLITVSVARFVVLWLLGGHLSFVHGQEDAKCVDVAFQWSFNSKGHSPCHIAYALGLQCPLPNNAILNIEAARPGMTYFNGLDIACGCNTVYYHLITVCAQCQGATVQPWTNWISGCSNTYKMELGPVPFPSEAPIPRWAFHSLTSSDAVDLAAAQAETGPELTAAPSSSASLPTSSNPSQSSGTSNNDTSGKKSTPIGSIVGGVVGGVLGLALIIGGVIVLLRRKKRSTGGDAGEYPSSGGEEKFASPTFQSTPFEPTPLSSISPLSSPGHVGSLHHDFYPSSVSQHVVAPQPVAQSGMSYQPVALSPPSQPDPHFGSKSPPPSYPHGMPQVYDK